jgi:hypothetical protein
MRCAARFWRLGIPVLLMFLVPAPAPAIELRDAELVAGGQTVLQNATGTVRIEDARVGRVSPATFTVPVPICGSGAGEAAGVLIVIALERRRRGRKTRSDTNQEIVR